MTSDNANRHHLDPEMNSKYYCVRLSGGASSGCVYWFIIVRCYHRRLQWNRARANKILSCSVGEFSVLNNFSASFDIPKTLRLFEDNENITVMIVKTLLTALLARSIKDFQEFFCFATREKFPSSFSSSGPSQVQIKSKVQVFAFSVSLS